jgi:hypothetical protein
MTAATGIKVLAPLAIRRRPGEKIVVMPVSGTTLRLSGSYQHRGWDARTDATGPTVFRLRPGAGAVTEEVGTIWADITTGWAAAGFDRTG